jgi:hypothetical protein
LDSTRSKKKTALAFWLRNNLEEARLRGGKFAFATLGLCAQNRDTNQAHPVPFDILSIPIVLF